ncbi:hypothetical protein BGZ46_008382 [Entomortierella lignicola]|nr:hypothetical protein BGZ46_008382 [Entomortierella lignicola]
MTLSIFDIPHIRDGIAFYLSNHDILQCALTSKEWFSWFSPSFNYHADLYSIASAKYGFSNLKQHQSYARSMTLRNKSLISYTATLLPFPNLQSLDFAFQEPSIGDNVLVDFISAIPSLKSVRLSIARIPQNSSERLIGTLGSHPNLENLGLVILILEDPKFIPRLLCACKNYKSLQIYPMSLVEAKDIEETPKRTSEFNINTDPTPFLRCRELSINFPNPMRRGHFEMVQMLHLLPQLESLILFKATGENLLQVSDLLKENACPFLKRLHLVNVGIHDINKEVIVALIRALGIQRRTIVNGIQRNSPHDTCSGLKSFVADFYIILNMSIPRALAEYHAETLTTLDLSNSRTISFLPFMYALSNLPKLLLVKAPVWLSPELSVDPMELEKQLGIPWSCLGLRTLDLTIGLQNIAELSDNNIWKTSIVHLCANYIFLQISEMNNLQMLGLRSTIQLLTMEKGYLTQLTGLKQLRHLAMSGGNLELGKDEAEWMIEHWKRLIHITLRHIGEWEAYKFMKEKRPWITIEKFW